MAHIVHKAIQFTAGNAGIPFDIDGFNNAAIVKDGTEYLESRIPEQVGNVVEMHIKTEIRFIGTVEIHGVVPFNSLEGDFNIPVQDFLEDPLHHVFHEVQDEVLVFKGQFHIQLGEFRLAVSTEVFIAEAAGYLEVPFQTGYHEQLFKSCGDWGSA